MRALTVLLVTSAAACAAPQPEPREQDRSQKIWCGDGPCVWSVDAGQVRAIPAWSELDPDISEPISWLELERFALGELAAGPVARIERHLHDCRACAGCFNRIRQAGAQPLPELSAGARAAVPATRRTLRPRWSRLGPSLALAGAAAVGLALARSTLERASGTATKGIDVALTLIREREGSMTEDPPGYRPGDRWKAVATCPAGRELAWALVLFQEGSPATPIGSGTGLACANRVPLPGAFRLTGTGQAAVCFLGLVGSTAAPQVASGDLAAIEHAGAACVRLSSEPVAR